MMGLSAQLIGWPVPFCEGLAERGFRVIRYDNRDVGLSQKFDGQKPPGLLRSIIWRKLGLPLKVPYSLHDMADDVVGLLDALELPQAHIVGISMGGMLAQTMAAQYPQRVLTLTSIMSSSGNPALPPPDRSILRHLLTPPGEEREAIIAHRLKFWRMVESTAWPTDEEELRSNVSASVDRAFYPEGMGRHIAAIGASGNRVPLLKEITAPTLVIHGTNDPIAPMEGGKDTARHIAGSRLELIEGMGHDLPRQLWPRLVTLIADHADSVR
jgi:pimeloyl-ACP methyl ester carboxylesterase